MKKPRRPVSPIAAVLQMSSGLDVEKNVSQATALLSKAKKAGAALAALPEGFSLLGPDSHVLKHAEDLSEGGPILDTMRALARKHSIALILGGFWEKIPGDPNHVYNSCVYLNKKGEVSAVYRKIHLFDVSLPKGLKLKESALVRPGGAAVVAQTNVGPTGLSICYDLRFPELYRALVDRGAKVLAVPAAFTSVTGPAHWEVLLRARAIESQCWVLAPAQVGKHYGNRRSHGHAMICDPWGNVRTEIRRSAPGLAIEAIDLAELETIRLKLPSLNHRVKILSLP